mgnify:CR=1 FL=1|jgi:hypothetical protein
MSLKIINITVPGDSINKTIALLNIFVSLV